MEPIIDWEIIRQVGPFVFFGLMCHLLDKFDSARKKKCYSRKIFIRDNWVSYLTATIICIVGTGFLGSGVEMLQAGPKVVLAFTLGYGGGSLIRSMIVKSKK